MSEVVFEEHEDEEDKKDKKINNKETIRFHGKDITVEKLQKKMSHKPRILGTIIINLTIVIVIIIVILLIL